MTNNHKVLIVDKKHGKVNVETFTEFDAALEYTSNHRKKFFADGRQGVKDYTDRYIIYHEPKVEQQANATAGVARLAFKLDQVENEVVMLLLDATDTTVENHVLAAVEHIVKASMHLRRLL